MIMIIHDNGQLTDTDVIIVKLLLNTYDST